MCSGIPCVKEQCCSSHRGATEDQSLSLTALIDTLEFGDFGSNVELQLFLTSSTEYSSYKMDGDADYSWRPSCSETWSPTGASSQSLYDGGARGGSIATMNCAGWVPSRHILVQYPNLDGPCICNFVQAGLTERGALYVIRCTKSGFVSKGVLSNTDCGPTKRCTQCYQA